MEVSHNSDLAWLMRVGQAVFILLGEGNARSLFFLVKKMHPAYLCTHCHLHFALSFVNQPTL
eukprot:scaffold201723_cov10-Tisochrysis_lutea.AAC.1